MDCRRVLAREAERGFGAGSWTLTGRRGLLLTFLLSGEGFSLCFLVAMEKQGIVGDRLFDELFKKEQLGTVDNGVHALLKSLHGGKGLKRIAEQNDCGTPAL